MAGRRRSQDGGNSDVIVYGMDRPANALGRSQCRSINRKFAKVPSWLAAPVLRTAPWLRPLVTSATSCAGSFRSLRTSCRRPAFPPKEKKRFELEAANRELEERVAALKKKVEAFRKATGRT